jgi:integrase
MARWQHVDLETGEWFIPKANVKGNSNDFAVYLSDFALSKFRQLYELTGQTEWCFPAKNKNGHVDVKSMSKQVGDRQAMFKKSKDGGPREPMQHRRHDNSLVLGNGKCGAWTPHDLRRTGATMMQSLGLSLDIIDRCQNHVLFGSKVRRHYLHHDYANEKREAWGLLGGRLSLLLGLSGKLSNVKKAA